MVNIISGRINIYCFRADEYVSRGVRYIYRESTFSQDLEPEYIQISRDDTMAYIMLQVSFEL